MSNRQRGDCLEDFLVGTFLLLFVTLLLLFVLVCVSAITPASVENRLKRAAHVPGRAKLVEIEGREAFVWKEGKETRTYYLDDEER